MTGNNMKTGLLKVAFLTIFTFSQVECSREKLVQDSISDSYPKEFIFLPTGSNASLIMTFNDRWHLSAPEWVQCSRISGSEGTVALVLSTSVNKSGQDRAGVLTFDCDDGTTVSLPVNQPRPFLRVSFSEEPSGDEFLSFNWNDSREQGGRYVSVSVESNVDWRFDFKDLSTPEREFVLSQDKGFGSSKLTLVPRRNNIDREAYECLLTADAYMPGEDGELIGEGVESFSIPLHQDNLRFLINNDTGDFECNVDELGEGTVAIDVDTELPWSILSLPDWISISQTSGDAGISQIVMQANSINPTREERVQDIVLHSSGGAERTVRFKQDPFVFSVEEPEVIIENASSSTAVIHFNSSGPWSVSGPDWLEITPEGQEGNGTVTMSCPEQNLELTDLKDVLRFTSQLNELVEEASVSQKAFVFDIIPDDIINKIPALSTNTYPITVKSSGDWSVSSEQSWVTLSSEGGSKDGSVAVNANSENPDLETDRQAVITFVSETHKAHGITLKKDIPLTQTKFLFSISQSATKVPAYTTSSFIMDIVCSSKWEIVQYPDWLVPDSTSGTFDKKVTFTITPNTNKSQSRSGSIRVRSIFNNAYKETDPITQDKFVFKIDQTAFNNLPPVNVGQNSFAITCTEEAPWSIVSNDDWISLSATGGTGSSTIDVTTSDNPIIESRSSSLMVTNTISKETIKVSFSQAAFVFSVPASAFSFGELDSSQKTISVDCSSGWTVEYDNAPWIKLSTTAGSGKGDIMLNVEKNVETKSREASFTIYSNLQRGTAYELKKEISVSQDAYKFDTKTESFAGLDAINDKGTSKSVKITCSGEWAVESSPSWLTINPYSGKGNSTITFTPLSNTDLTARTGVFDIVSKDNSSLRKRVSVNQNAYIFNVDTQKLAFTSAVSSKSINIHSTAKWTARTDQSWITLSAKEGTGNQAIIVTVDKNSSKEDRSGKITLTSEYGNHVLTVEVTQTKP